MQDDKVKKYLHTLDGMKAVRKPWEDEWQDIADFIPGFGDFTAKRGSGDKRGPKKAYDGTATYLLRLMADGLFGKLTPPSIPWFKLMSSNTALDKFRPFRVWIEECDYSIYKAIERSNFYDVLANAFYWGGAIGTVVMLMEEDPKDNKVQFSLRHIKECYVASDRFGRPNTVYRETEQELRTVVEHFGDELGEDIIRRAEKNPFELMTILHCVEPDGAGAWTSAYILMEAAKPDGSRIIHEGRYPEFPYLVWTFREDAIDPYGRSPTMDALYDIEMLNFQAKLNAEAGHLAVKPPLVAHQSFNGKLRFNPGSMTYFSQVLPGVAMPQPLYGNSINYQVGVDQQERRSQILRQHYRTDIFSYLTADMMNGSSRERTATEINAIEAQGSTLLSTITGRIQKQICERVISYFFRMESEAGRLPVMPQELQQAIAQNPQLVYDPFDIEYTGPLAQGQKRYLTSQGIMRGAQAIGNLMQIAPEIKDGYDWLSIANEASESEGLPASKALDPKVIKKIREQRAAQEAAVMQTQMQGEQAKAYAATTKAPEPGSPADPEAR